MKALILSFALSGVLTAHVASWSWERVAAPDRLEGFHRFAPGIAGQALRSDGQTTRLIRPAAQAPRLDGPFTVEAWVAIQTNPWCSPQRQEASLSGLLHQAILMVQADEPRRVHNAVAGWQLVSMAAVRNAALAEFRNSRS